MMAMDCKTCHKVSEKSIGPAYTLVSAKYPNNQKSVDYLINKIKKGGAGVWGETAMAAHPDINQNDVTTIVQWILGLNQKTPTKPSLAASGSIKPTLGKPLNDKAALLINATYIDKGGADIKPLTGTSTVLLQSNNVLFNKITNKKAFDTDDDDGIHYMTTPSRNEGWFSIDHIDLTGITSASLMLGIEKMPTYGYTFELHLDAPDGKLLGTADLKPSGKAEEKEDPNKKKKRTFETLTYHFAQPITDGKFHDVYIVSKPLDDKERQDVGLGALKFEMK